ncbi:glycosyltransferase family protein [Salibaculum griseiflavum]|uniref:Glycosyl transferase n=1 Tax=Salibaculum griseiflavum TaxID=1914409 RepID=A0A2V1P0V0_9RHOB|nr:hypothetical protein [Salibaculum griseiflavum]PWG16171.1 hypothetical protein DFK10_13360 [Salibaculum griseiflavum]
MIQVVLVKWGRKYDPRYIHGLLDAIRRHTARDLRVVCITDDATGLSPDIITRPFPDLGMPLQDMTAFGGCLPKLSMFAPAVLDPDLKTIYLDIDTGVFGDIGELVDLLDTHPCLHALPNHFLPHWRTPWLSWMTPEGCYFINSSVMVFRPGQHADIFTDFLDAFHKAYRPEIARKAMPLPLRSDERFISQHEKGKLRALPRSLAGSFKDLYMGPLDRILGTFPFLMKSRGRVALTFHGDALKPDLMAGFEPGQEIRQGGFRTRWRHPEFARYWADILAPDAPDDPGHDPSK